MEDLTAFRRRARAWLAAAPRPELHGDYDARFAALTQWQGDLYAAGWVGIDWPADVGGQGLTVQHALAFAEELVAAGLPQPVGAIGLEVVGPTIERHGTDEQRRTFLPPMLAGEELWCQGFSEPGAGSDLAALRTGAVRDGDELVLNGQKVWTSWGTHARWAAVLARTDRDALRHRGISYLLVDMRSPGVTVRPIVQMTGDAEFNELFFDDVRVPVANVLGGFGDGWRLAMDTLGHERSHYALRRRRENEIAFAALVHGVRDGGRPVPGHRLADLGELFVSLKAFEAQTRATALRLDAAHGPSPLDSVDKLTLTDTEQHLYRVAVDLLGPERMAVGMTATGLEAESWLKGLLYARSASVYGGSNQIQRSIVAERHLGLPRSR